MNDELKSELKNHYLGACIGAMVTAALGIVLYPAEHGIKTAGRGAVLVAAFVVIGLFIATVARSLKERELDQLPGEGAITAWRRLKKMAILWNLFGGLFATTLIRIPGLKWYRGLETLTRLDQVSLILGIALLSLLAFRLFRAVRIQIPD